MQQHTIPIFRLGYDDDRDIEDCFFFFWFLVGGFSLYLFTYTFEWVNLSVGHDGIATVAGRFGCGIYVKQGTNYIWCLTILIWARCGRYTVFTGICARRAMRPIYKVDNTISLLFIYGVWWMIGASIHAIGMLYSTVIRIQIRYGIGVWIRARIWIWVKVFGASLIIVREIGRRHTGYMISRRCICTIICFAIIIQSTAITLMMMRLTIRCCIYTMAAVIVIIVQIR